MAAEEASALEKVPESSAGATASAEAAEGSSSSAPRTTEAAVPSIADEGRAAYVFERPFVSLSDLQNFAGVEKAQRGECLGQTSQHMTLSCLGCTTCLNHHRMKD